MTRTIDLRKQHEHQDSPANVSGTEPHGVQEPVPVAAPASGHFFGRSLGWTLAHVRQRHPHSTTIVVGGLAASAALVWFFQGNLLFTLLLIMCAGAFAIMPREPRTKVRVVLAEHGITINDAQYHYQQIRSFWVTHLPDAPRELSLETAQWHTPYIRVPLGDQNPLHVRDFLAQYLPEKEHHHSLVDALVHLADRFS